MSKLIQKVVAQSEPTFPYDGPFEPPETPPPAIETAQVKLSTSTSTLQIDATTTVDLRIESDEAEVQSYDLTITFDSDIIEVVDSNTVQTGTQIDFLDTFATVQDNSANNSTGTISISAQVSGGTQSINRRIAQITFRAKATGTSIVSVNKAQSSVENDSGEDILGATTSLNFTVTGQTQTTPDESEALPSSGIKETLTTFGSVLGGILMLYVGIKLVIDNRKEKNLNENIIR